MDMTVGDLRGSIFRPLLRNIGYDYVLRIESLPDGVETLPYDEDLTVVVETKHRLYLKLHGNMAPRSIHERMNSVGLELAPKKSEAVLLIVNVNVDLVNFEMADKDIKIGRYLGVHLVRSLRGNHHIKIATQKSTGAATT